MASRSHGRLVSVHVQNTENTGQVSLRMWYGYQVTSNVLASRSGRQCGVTLRAFAPAQSRVGSLRQRSASSYHNFPKVASTHQLEMAQNPQAGREEDVGERIMQEPVQLSKLPEIPVHVVVQQHGRHDKRRVPTCRLVSHRNSATSPTKCFSACRARGRVAWDAAGHAASPRQRAPQPGVLSASPKRYWLVWDDTQKCLHLRPSPASRSHGWRGRGAAEEATAELDVMEPRGSSRERAKPRQAPAPDLTSPGGTRTATVANEASIGVLGEGPPPPPWRR